MIIVASTSTTGSADACSSDAVRARAWATGEPRKEPSAASYCARSFFAPLASAKKAPSSIPKNTSVDEHAALP